MTTMTTDDMDRSNEGIIDEQELTTDFLAALHAARTNQSTITPASPSTDTDKLQNDAT